MSEYKDAIAAAMTALGQEPEICFVGYNVRYGKAAGSLNGVPEDKLLEFPLAENLMMGAAIGLALDGRIPVVYFERADFLTNAMDAIVNHLAKLDELSEGLHRPACIIRVVVGNSATPLFTGPTHCQDFSDAMIRMVSFPVWEMREQSPVAMYYSNALRHARSGLSTMLFEFKDNY